MQLCRARRNATIKPLEFSSKSNPDKVYNVYLFRQDKEHKPEAPLCTCMPFLTGRKKAAKAAGTEPDETFFACSHIKQAEKDVCNWTEFDPDKPGYVYDGTCPKCGGPVVEDEALGLSGVTKPVLDQATQTLTNMEEVRRLAAELKGVPYEPLPVPVAHMPVLSTECTAGPGDVQRVEILADDNPFMTFTWAEDCKSLSLFLPGRTPAAYVIDIDEDFPNVIKEIEWPTK